MSLLRDMIAAQEEAYLTVGVWIYRLRSVDSAALLGVGHAYLAGIEQHLRLAEEGGLPSILAEMRQVGASEEAIAKASADYQADVTIRRQRAHLQAISTPEGAAAYRERVEAFALASIVGIGPAPVRLEAVPGLMPIERHPIGYSAPTEPVRVVRAPPPVDRYADAMAYVERGEWPTWMIPAQHLEAIGLIAAQLAGGRAASVAPFRFGTVVAGGA
jgi:hypothetical protein